ncbi:hypothetical protein [Natronorubrum tibetense]|uniref:Uncharacterized protein n=1 Tax=Natronorubrum tibetense GA33 TaxID=1114856 RepID=L9W0N7_9EURY|nr:hypothetical protein [Natronorubrum tibetense]ELY43000.1 hypothetical protein C496_06687 [Natronorubrum tibetense GA33]
MTQYSAERCSDCHGKKIARTDGTVWCPNCALFRPQTTRGSQS